MLWYAPLNILRLMSQIIHDQPCSIMQGAEASLSYCQYYGYGAMNIFNEMLECCGQ